MRTLAPDSPLAAMQHVQKALAFGALAAVSPLVTADSTAVTPVQKVLQLMDVRVH